MTIELDNNQRVFLIKRDGFFNRQYFCNLHHIPSILKDELEKNDTYTISEYWNFKFKKVGKKRINEMFGANQINFNL